MDNGYGTSPFLSLHSSLVSAFAFVSWETEQPSSGFTAPYRTVDDGLHSREEGVGG